MEQVQIVLPISRDIPTEFQVTGGARPQLQAFGAHIRLALAAAGNADGVLDEHDAAAAEALMQAATEYRDAVRARVAAR